MTPTRPLAIALLLCSAALAGCSDGAGSGPGPGGGAADEPAQTGCESQNFLSRDSFDVAAFGFRNCINGDDPTCEISAQQIRVLDLDEGVGTLTARYEQADDETMTLTIDGNPDTTEAPEGVVMTATGVSPTVVLQALVMDLYWSPEAETTTLGCTWQ